MRLDSYLAGLNKSRLCGSEYEAGNANAIVKW
jgi:hypothetical protein